MQSPPTNQAMKNRNLTTTAIILIALIGIIGFINIRLIQSNTNTEYTGTTFTSGTPEVQLRNPLNLHVIGDDQYTKTLESHLVQLLEKEDIDVTIIEELQTRYEEQTLIVMATEKNIGYNPVTPNAAVQTSFFYFSNGDTSYLDALINDEVIELFGGPVLIQEGKIALTDSSLGFASYPGYLDHLALKIAEKIMEHLPDK
jgi:hypothetical protein